MNGIKIAGAIALILVIALLLYVRFAPSVSQDVCLDGGGKWENGDCVGRRPNG